MKKLVFILFVSVFNLSSIHLNAQDLTQGRPTSEINHKVGDELEYLTKKLALTGKQQKLTKLKLTEFAMKEKQLINSKMTSDKKQKQILALRDNKIKEMRDILSGPQHDKYVKLIKEKRKTNRAEMLEK